MLAPLGQNCDKDVIMKRLFNCAVVSGGVVLLSATLSMTGLGGTMAATVQKGVQQVLITNKSVTVRGSVTAKVTGSVNAAPSAPVQPI